MALPLLVGLQPGQIVPGLLFTQWVWGGSVCVGGGGAGGALGI